MVGVRMKSFLSLFAALLLIVSTTEYAEAGKRFGSGGLGKSHSSAPAQKQAEPQNNQPGGANQAAPATSKSKGLMGGILGGLLAGGIFAYLLGSGAFEGIQFLDILLLAGVAFLIFKLLRSGKRQQPVPASGPSGYQPTTQDASVARKSDDFSRMMSNTSDSAPMNLPDDFDADAFTQGALSHYRTVQQAWNDADLEEIRSYVSPELFDALAQQRQELTDPPRTEVLDLTANIVRADQVEQVRQISILFRGRCRDLLDGSEDGIFDTWHLERDISQDNAPWLIVGIEAE